MLENSAWITLHFHSPDFQNYTKCLTQTNTTQWWRVFIVLPQELQTRSDLSSARNILFTRITSNEPVCFEGWNKFSVPIWSPWEPNLTHRRSGCQLGLLSINFDFRNVIFQPMVFPFVWAKYKLMKLYKRSLQALLSSAPRGFAARLHVLARLASLTQIGELARRLDLCLISHHLHWSISGVDFCVFLVWINCFLYPRHIHCKLTVFWGELFHAKSSPWHVHSVHVVT